MFMGLRTVMGGRGKIILQSRQEDLSADGPSSSTSLSDLVQCVFLVHIVVDFGAVKLIIS